MGFVSADRFDVIVVGAGAAGLFFAGEAGKRGRRVLVIDHAKKIGEKIRISGGGRCNFTNVHASADQFISQNPKFAISALKQYTPRDFISEVDKAGISWHEKKLGQLFCNDKAQQIVDLLLEKCRAVNVRLESGRTVDGVERVGERYVVTVEGRAYSGQALVVACGGKSIPKIGASGFGYELATQFGVDVVETRPALVPLVFDGALKELTASLAGVSTEAAVSAPQAVMSRKQRGNTPPTFREPLLFTHRGLSGPSILQISSYWREGHSISIDLSPLIDIGDDLKRKRGSSGKVAIHTALGELIPSRLARYFCEANGWTGNLADYSDKKIDSVAGVLSNWSLVPVGSEGYRTAEVTLGGVDTAMLDSKSMAVKSVPGLYFIGEVVDVTGWLGGYNFQWAWSSAFAAAQAV